MLARGRLSAFLSAHSDSLHIAATRSSGGVVVRSRRLRTVVVSRRANAQPRAAGNAAKEANSDANASTGDSAPTSGVSAPSDVAATTAPLRFKNLVSV